MRNITLISTYHAEKGACNVFELHQILERARPDVIFVEVPPAFHDEFYVEKTSSNLESNAVNRYLQTHKPHLEPVDVLALPADVNAENEDLHRRVGKVSRDYRNLMDWNSQEIEQHGFA